VRAVADSIVAGKSAPMTPPAADRQGINDADASVGRGALVEALGGGARRPSARWARPVRPRHARAGCAAWRRSTRPNRASDGDRPARDAAAPDRRRTGPDCAGRRRHTRGGSNSCVASST
jgi:hypothetical protein